MFFYVLPLLMCESKQLPISLESYEGDHGGKKRNTSIFALEYFIWAGSKAGHSSRLIDILTVLGRNCMNTNNIRIEYV